MADRANLKAALETILGSTKVYFQPPSQLTYPCIICEKSGYDLGYGDNRIYRQLTHYTVTLIGKTYNNDSIVEGILAIPYASFNRRFVSDNLYHDVFDLYY